MDKNSRKHNIALIKTHGDGLTSKLKKESLRSSSGNKKIKKGGAGGKGTWGVGGKNDLAPIGSSIDEGDPNFDENVANEAVLDPVDYEDPQKYIVLEIIREFIESGELDEAVADVERRKNIEGPEFVKRALIFGIEHKAYERELISQLLSAVYNIFQNREMPDGFQLVIDRLPDLVLDVPDATDIVGKFIARALADEILPPIFLVDALINNEHAGHAISFAKDTTNYSSDKIRLEHVWGPGDLSSVDRIRDEVEIILQEYLDNKDLRDTSSSIRELNTPSFYSQIVKQALILALQKNDGWVRESIIELIHYFEEISLMTLYDIKHGFDLVWRRVGDIKLDVPNAEEMLTLLTHLGKERKLLPQNYFGKQVSSFENLESVAQGFIKQIHASLQREREELEKKKQEYKVFHEERMKILENERKEFQEKKINSGSQISNQNKINSESPRNVPSPKGRAPNGRGRGRGNRAKGRK